ncbi:MAG TPA: potassium-transporting ATPase subunit C [Thermoleophilaceae bacterium]|jgi:K+-transporting ATPase ATPase C chain
MRRDLISAALAVIVLTVLLGLVYPLVVTGVSQVAFHGNANGQKITSDGKLVGSKIIGQDFRVPVIGANGKPKTDSDGNPVLVADRKYFQERPSTATNYNAAASAFTNLGPNSKDARDTFKANLASYLQLERPFSPGLTAKDVPVDAVTSSASGVDPQISQANAAIQARRIAAVRRLPLPTVQKLIKQNTDGRFLGVLGEPGVDVLQLNLALDGLSR